MEIRVNLTEQDLQSLHSSLEKKLQVAAVKAFEAAVERTPAAGVTPYSTGQLRQSLRVAKTGNLEYTIFCPRDYGVFLEFGTGPRGQATGMVEGFENDPYNSIVYHQGEVLVTRANHHMLDTPYIRHTQGMEAQPFLRPALMFGYEKLKELMR